MPNNNPNWLDTILYKDAQANGTLMPARNALNFVGQGVTVADNPGNNSTDVTVGLGGAYTQLFDLDLTALGTQSLAANGAYTIGGIAFTRYNAASDRVAMALTNGTGLVITPSSGTYSGGQPPLLLFNPATLIPGFTLRTPWRMSMRTVDNAAADRDLACVLACDPGTIANHEINAFMAAERGYVNGTDVGFQTEYFAGAMPTYTIVTASTASGLYAANTVVVLDAPQGILGLEIEMSIAPWVGPGWPSHGSELPAGLARLNAGALEVDNWMRAAANWGLGVGAFSAASAYSTTIQRLRFEYVPPS